MNRASYRHGVRWIAENDSGASESALDPDEVGYLVTSLLLADLFGVEPERVGADVVRERRKMAQHWYPQTARP